MLMLWAEIWRYHRWFQPIVDNNGRVKPAKIAEAIIYINSKMNVMCVHSISYARRVFIVLNAMLFFAFFFMNEHTKIRQLNNDSLEHITIANRRKTRIFLRSNQLCGIIKLQFLLSSLFGKLVRAARKRINGRGWIFSDFISQIANFNSTSSEIYMLCSTNNRRWFKHIDWWDGGRTA